MGNLNTWLTFIVGHSNTSYNSQKPWSGWGWRHTHLTSLYNLTTKPIESSVLSSSDLSVAAATTLHSLGSKAWLSLYFFYFPYWHGFLAPFLYWMGVYPFENLSKAMNLYVTQATLWVTPGHWNLSSNALSLISRTHCAEREPTQSCSLAPTYIPDIFPTHGMLNK